MVQYADGTARTEGLWVYTNSAWTSVAASGTTSSSYLISNLGIATSVGANALTIYLKDASGSDPSGGSPVIVAFRNATLTTGQYSLVSTTGALSLTISSGSTLGQVSGVEGYLYVYLINNAGAAELAVSSVQFSDEGTVISTTAEGGAGAADAVGVMYSTTARTNVAYKLIGRIRQTQATAGTWTSAGTELSLIPFNTEFVGCSYETNAGQSLTSGAITQVIFEDKILDSHGMMNTGTGTVTIPISGKYLITFQYLMAPSTAWEVTEAGAGYIYKNGTQVCASYYSLPASTASSLYISSGSIQYLNSFIKGDTVDCRIYQDSDSTRTLQPGGVFNRISVTKVG